MVKIRIYPSEDQSFLIGRRRCLPFLRSLLLLQQRYVNRNILCNPMVTPVELQEMERSAKKRARTKFTAERKEKMLAFAEKLGWRIQRDQDAGIGSEQDGSCFR